MSLSFPGRGIYALKVRMEFQDASEKEVQSLRLLPQRFSFTKFH